MNKTIVRGATGLAAMLAGGLYFTAEKTPSRTPFEQAFDRINVVLGQYERTENGNTHSGLIESFGNPTQGGVTYIITRFNGKLTLEQRRDLGICEGRRYSLDPHTGLVAEVSSIKQNPKEAPGFRCDYVPLGQPTEGDQLDAQKAIKAVGGKI